MDLAKWLVTAVAQPRGPTLFKAGNTTAKNPINRPNHSADLPTPKQTCVCSLGICLRLA